MLSLPATKVIYLGSTGFERTRMFSADTEQQKLSDVAKIEANPTTVRSAVLADFVPDKVALVSETPSAHNRDALRQKSIWDPQVQVANLSSGLLHGQSLDVIQRHCVVSGQSLVLWGNLARSIRELPRGVGQNRPELSITQGS